MVGTMSRAGMRDFEGGAPPLVPQDCPLGNRIVTYFAVTGGLKDAWRVVGADREYGDVHSGQREEDGGWLAVEERTRREILLGA